MKLAIIGSRTFKNYDFLKKVADLEVEWHGNVEEIISGGARGADYLGKKYALEKGIAYTEFKADWDKHGKSAGFIRNHDIIKNCDAVICFWDGESKGSKHAIDLALKHNKDLLTYTFNEKEE